MPKSTVKAANKLDKSASSAAPRSPATKAAKEDKVYVIGYYHGASAKVAEVRVRGFDIGVIGEMDLQVWALLDAKGRVIFSIPSSALVYCICAETIEAPSAPVLAIK